MHLNIGSSQSYDSLEAYCLDISTRKVSAIDQGYIDLNTKSISLIVKYQSTILYLGFRQTRLSHIMDWEIGL